MPDDELLFRETQRFCQPWIIVMVLLSDLAVIGVMGYLMISQLVYGRPVGDRPLPDSALVVVGLLAVLTVLATSALFFVSNLLTQVRRDGLYVRFFPFHRRFRRIALDKLTSFRALTYRPIWEYGGWGLRCRRGGRAYNVRGRRGVRLEFNDGKHLLIGSQKADELAAAIDALLKSTA